MSRSVKGFFPSQTIDLTFLTSSFVLMIDILKAMAMILNSTVDPHLSGHLLSQADSLDK